jgi:hypothetical protein
MSELTDSLEKLSRQEEESVIATGCKSCRASYVESRAVIHRAIYDEYISSLQTEKEGEK